MQLLFVRILKICEIEKALMDKIQLEAWRLFITSNARLLQIIDKELTDAGKIPLHWYDVLIELYEAPERRLRMHELAEKVVLSRSGLTRLVDRLEEAKYLQREADPQDRRGFYTSITEQGIVALREAWTVYSQTIEAHFAQHLSVEEATLMVKVFGKILEHTS
jgi:DNA-binding MarR family transcriptional regulator